MFPGYAELEFDLAGALLSEVTQLFDEMEPANLTVGNVGNVEEAAGVYALYRKSTGNLLYLGKAEGAKGLNNRLNRHLKKIDGREGITPSEVQFKAIRLFVFAAMDLEAALIKHYGGPKNVPWNNSGFGSNDPGKERDTTKYKKGHFDTDHPIRLDASFVEFAPGAYAVSDIMQKLKDNLPYLLRFQRPSPSSKKSFEPEFLSMEVEIPHSNMTIREIVKLCVDGLPAGWKATALPSHIICYKNDTRKFPSGVTIAG